MAELALLEEESPPQLRQRTYIRKHYQFTWSGTLPELDTNPGTRISYLPNIYKNSTSPLFQFKLHEFKLEHLVTNWMLKGHQQRSCLQGDSYLGIELNLVEMSLEGDTNTNNSKYIVPFDLTFTIHIYKGSWSNMTHSSGPHQVAFNTLGGNEVRGGSIKPADVAALFKYQEVIPADRLLRIRVSLTLGLEVPKPQIHDHALVKLSADMNELLATGARSDSVINRVFAKMFDSGLTETQTNTVEIPDFEPAVIKYMLIYIYTSKFDPTKMKFEELFGLAKAAHKYELAELHGFCLDVLLCNLNEKNCGSLAVLGYLQDTDFQFKMAVFTFCATHWASLADDEEFQNLVKEYPEAFFKPKANQ